jgi:AmpD protein
LLTLSRHWVDQARQLPSPNCGDRPDPDDISLIIVHNISLPPGEFGGGHVDALFTNRLDPAAHPSFRPLEGLHVSSHFLIDRAGELTQYVACQRRAWHAGRSSWGGREECNDFAIGIELEGTDDIPYEAAQYYTLAELVALLQRSYPRLEPDAVAGHEDVAPGRKTDPGPAFDWAFFRARLAARRAADEGEFL